MRFPFRPPAPVTPPTDDEVLTGWLVEQGLPTDDDPLRRAASGSFTFKCHLLGVRATELVRASKWRRRP